MHWIEEAKQYVGFSEEDERRLHALHALGRAGYAAIIDHFYAVIEQFAGARQVITGGPPQIAHLKVTLLAWLESGVGGPHDLAWYEARSRIGRRHVAIGLASRYMFTAANLVRADLHRLAGGIAGIDLAATGDAIDRWLDLELAIMLHSYQEDHERQQLAAMQRMAAGLAHEVRNPLNSAQLQLQLLSRRLKRAGAEPGLLEVTSLVDGEIRRLSGLLQEFLDFARPVQLAIVDCDLVGVAQQVVELANVAARARQIEVVLTGEPAVVISCDPGKVHQILQNLIANALDAARSRVEVDLRADDAAAILRVRDDGPGIPEGVLPRIYEPFFSTKEHGTGMGLSITYSLVSLHGGSIEVQNQGGAEFTVRLPAEPPPPDAIASAITSGSANGTGTRR